MTEIGFLIVIGMAMLFSIVLLKISDEGDMFIVFTLGLLFTVVSVIMSIVYASIIWEWHAAEYKANIINREYGTSYTQEEVYYAKGVIDTIREIDRQRIEINGNLLNKK